MSKKKLFIPMSIDKNSTQNIGYFNSPLKMAIMIGSIIPGIFLVFYIFSQSESWLASLVVGLIYLFINSYVIRFLVLEERKLKRMMKEMEKNKISGAEYFWGVDEVDEEGVIHYKYDAGIKKAVVVRVNRGSLVGTSPQFEGHYKDVKTQFLRELLRQNLGYLKYTKLEKKQLPEGVNDYTSKLSNLPDGSQRQIARMNLETISRFTKQNKAVNVDYYVIFNRELRLINAFKGRVKDIINTHFGNEVYFKGSRVLDGEEVIDFFEEVLLIKGIDKNGYYKDEEDRKFEEFGKVMRLFDDVGKEIFVGFEEKVEKKKGNRLSGKDDISLDDLADELEEDRQEEYEKEKQRLAELEEEKEEEEEEIEYVYMDENENIIEVPEGEEVEYEEILVEDDISIEDLVNKKGSKGRRK